MKARSHLTCHLSSLDIPEFGILFTMFCHVWNVYINSYAFFMHSFNCQILMQRNLKDTVNVNHEPHLSIKNNMRHNARRSA